MEANSDTYYNTVEPADIKLSEIRQSKEINIVWLDLCELLRIVKFIETESGNGLPGVEDWKNGEL